MGRWKDINANSSIFETYASNSNQLKNGPFQVSISQVIPLADDPNFAFISGAFEGELKKEDGTVVKITEGEFKWLPEPR